jgi:hypothetical protein
MIKTDDGLPPFCPPGSSFCLPSALRIGFLLQLVPCEKMGKSQEPACTLEARKLGLRQGPHVEVWSRLGTIVIERAASDNRLRWSEVC